MSLGNAELKGVKLEEEQVVGFSFKNERCFLADVPGVNSSSAHCSRLTHLPLSELRSLQLSLYLLFGISPRTCST